MDKTFINHKNEKDQALPVAAEVDVVVAGSGPSGIAASLAAARKGMSVILLERFPFLGGMSTQIPIATWPLNTAIETGELDMPYDGIAGEILNALDEMGCIELKTIIRDGAERFVPVASDADKLATGKWYLFDPEMLKILYFDLLTKAGVQIRVNSLLVETIVKDGKVEGVVVETLLRRELIKGKIFIDTTGSAEIVKRSGGQAVWGAGKNDGVPEGLIVPTSTTFRMAGVDTEGLDMFEVAEIYEDFRQKGKINIPLDGLFWHFICKGVIHIWGTRVFGVDPLDPVSAALGEIEERRQIKDIFNFFKNEIPAFKDSILVNTGISLGCMGTRRIRGDYFITEKDIYDAVQFDDRIAIGTYRLEIWETDGSNCYMYHLPGKYYTIPFRSMLPLGFKNVFVAGSSISGQYTAIATWVVMPMCYKTGQAAGTAASICVKEDKEPRQISVDNLQNTLRADGMKLE